METINGVTFLYTNINTPKKRYQSEETEWSVQCCISKEQSKTWNKMFRKQQAKTFENDEYEEKFGVAPAFPDQDEQYVIKLSRDTHFKDGNPVDPKYAPKVFQTIGKGKVRDITKTVLVANGSTGRAAYDVVENSFGTFAKLHSICVDNLIEYRSKDANPFGDVVEDEETASKAAAYEAQDEKQELPATPVKKATKKPVEKQEESDDDSECPF